MTDDKPRATTAALREQIAAAQVRIDEIVFESKPLRDQLAKLDSERDRLKGERKRLEGLIDAITDGIDVSDHALVRYMERQLGHNFDAIRKEMITPGVRAAVNIGAEGVKAHGGSFKIKGRTITTYFTGKEERS